MDILELGISTQNISDTNYAAEIPKAALPELEIIDFTGTCEITEKTYQTNQITDSERYEIVCGIEQEEQTLQREKEVLTESEKIDGVENQEELAKKYCEENEPNLSQTFSQENLEENSDTNLDPKNTEPKFEESTENERVEQSSELQSVTTLPKSVGGIESQLESYLLETLNKTQEQDCLVREEELASDQEDPINNFKHLFLI